MTLCPGDHVVRLGRNPVGGRGTGVGLAGDGAVVSDILQTSWFWWSVGIAIGLPLTLIVLTEWQHGLRRRGSNLIGR